MGEKRKTQMASYRLSIELLERLEEAKWTVRATKTEIVAQALRDWLAHHGEGEQDEPQ